MTQKIILPVLLGLIFSSVLSAQDFNIKGKVVDAISKEPLEVATIYAESVKDSSLIAYTISNETGFFELEGKTKLKSINVFFSFNGYRPLVMKIDLKSKVDLKTVQLEEQAQELKGVDVIGERVPIKIKKDTLEFNAASFKTRPDATVEDVLKKLPGVEVASDGKIKVNGKEVDQVLVNGQVFFSNDPTIATKNLPKEIIDKIQITNTKTKEEEFVGDAGNGETRTINLSIKEDKNNGFLGRMTAGYGTDKRYQANGLLNYFNNKKRFSFIAGSNNINNAGFSFNEIFDMVGSGGASVDRNGGFRIGNQSFGSGKGITTSSTIGASFADQKKGAYEIDGNYFFAYSDSFNNQKTSRENILPDRRFFTNTESNFSGNTNSNWASVNLEFDIDKTLKISIQPSLNIDRTNSINARNTTSTNDQNEVINRNITSIVSDGQSRTFSNKLTLLKKLDTLGRYIRVRFDNNNIENGTKSNLTSLQEIFGNNPSNEELDQLTDSNNKSDSYSVGVRYRQPLREKLFLDFDYDYQNNQRNNVRSVFDFIEDSREYTDFNDLLSSDFKFKDKRHIPSIGLQSNGEKLRLALKARYNFTNLDNVDFLQNISFSKKYKNLLLRANVNYTIDRNKLVSMQYNSRLQVPSIDQLQPIPNINNPLNITVGNPNLSPAVAHTVNLNYNNYDWKLRSGTFVYMSVTFDKDRVSLVTNTNSDFLRTTTYTNVNGNYNSNIGVGYSKAIKKDSIYSISLNITPNANMSKTVSFTNNERLEAKSISINPRLSATFDFKEQIEFEPSYTISLNQTKYNLESIEDIKYTSHDFQLRTTTYWPENLIWGNDVVYSYNGNVGPGFDKDALFWNMSLGLQILNKKSTIKVLAYDLLNQNINTRRTTGDDFIQDIQGTVLQQYFMLSFSYKFDQFGGKNSRRRGVGFYG